MIVFFLGYFYILFVIFFFLCFSLGFPFLLSVIFFFLSFCHLIFWCFCFFLSFSHLSSRILSFCSSLKTAKASSSSSMVDLIRSLVVVNSSRVATSVSQRRINSPMSLYLNIFKTSKTSKTSKMSKTSESSENVRNVKKSKTLKPSKTIKTRNWFNKYLTRKTL